MRRGLLPRAARVKLLLLDVDGVLTDGRIYYGPRGEAMKAFDAKDGCGLAHLRDHVDLGVLSGRPGLATRRRLEELRFKHLIFGHFEKLPAYEELRDRLGLADEEVAYMGDDVNDLPVLERVGLSACPADARPEVRERVDFVSAAPGGRGAVRELCDLIQRAKGGPDRSRTKFGRVSSPPEARRLAALESRQILKRRTGKRNPDFLTRKLPRPRASVVDALLEERRRGR